jgi:hypothetical protein
MKIAEPVFSGTATISSSSLTPTIKLTNSSSSSQLKDVLVLANFDLSTQNVPTGFPYAGTWYNLMDNTSIVVNDVNAAIAIPAGGFRIYGNKVATLAIASYEKTTTIHLYPNPASNYFTLNTNTTKVQVFSISGQLVKSFNSNQTAGYPFSISDLSKGLYFVKALDENNEVEAMKFIKE